MINRGKQRILTDDEIIDVLINYVDEDLYNYAVMIDGEWGCGKTYFIQERLCSKLEAHEKEKSNHCEKYRVRRVVYLSLYGVKAVEEVSKQLLMESFLAKTGAAKGMLKKGSELVGSMLPVLFDVMKNKGLELDPNNVSEAAGKFISIKDSILIFDDLERCDCPINEILGYINTFVEHEGMKVIIVANQKEIGKSTYLANQELKYLVAAHKNIVFEEESKQNKILKQYGAESKKEDVAKPVNINVVKSRIDKLFGENELYERVKEKLVGITIYYYPALQSVFRVLVDNESIDLKLQGLLLGKCSFFEEYMVNEEHLNLRTFQFFLSKMSMLYETIGKLDGEGQEAFLNYIIQYCFKICVCYKKGILDYDWSGTEEYKFKHIGISDLFGNNLAFRFVDDFVVKNILNEDNVKKMFQVYVDEYVKKHNEEIEAFRELEVKWFLSTDEEVEMKIKEIIEALDEDKYDVNKYARIISLLIDLEDAGFPKENLEDAIFKMKINIKKLTYHIYLDSGYCSNSNDEKKEKLRRIIQELQNEIDNRFQKQVSESIGQYFIEEEGWAEKLMDYVSRNKQEIRNKSGFLSQMDINVLTQKIKKAKAYDVHALRACILELYVRNSIGPALEEDSERVNKLLESIQEFDLSDEGQFDRIRKMQISYLIENLKKVKEVYEKKVG